jgi:hypothetical protein
MYAFYIGAILAALLVALLLVKLYDLIKEIF